MLPFQTHYDRKDVKRMIFRKIEDLEYDGVHESWADLFDQMKGLEFLLVLF